MINNFINGREDEIALNAYVFSKSEENVPSCLRDNLIAQIAIKDSFTKGAEWADTHISTETIKKIIDLYNDWLSTNPVESDPSDDVKFIKKYLYE